MATKAQLLAAAKKIVAASTKTPAKNPAKRLGTAKPKRPSQITKQAPTNRLVARRKANSEEGYFPNPIETERAHAQCFHVYTIKLSKGKITGKPVAVPVKFLGSFPSSALAESFAKIQTVAVGVFKD